MTKKESEHADNLLSISIAPLKAPAEYYQQTRIAVMITNNHSSPVLIEQIILRFQSDASVASIYVEEQCASQLGPSALQEVGVTVSPTPMYLANTNQFDVMVRFRVIGSGSIGRQVSEIHRGSFLLLNKSTRACGQLFISFKQPDDLTLARLLEKLAWRAGFSPYLALHNAQPGTDLWERIERELKVSVAAVFIWTTHTDWGEGVKREIQLARKHHIPEILLIEDHVELPESHSETTVEYQRFDPQDPAAAFAKLLTARRAVVLG